jgi:hypothetical protein
MALLIVAIGSFVLAGYGKRAVSPAAEAPSAEFAGTGKALDWKVLAQTAICVEAVIALGLIVFSADAVDILGALTSGLVLAFILHLQIGGMRRR